MSSYHRTEVSRHLYFARLQLELAANNDLRLQQQLPPAAHEQLYFRAALHFLDQAYQHYLLEIAETTQCKMVANRASDMIMAWQAEGWFSDQLSELAALEQPGSESSTWLQDLLLAIDKEQPQLTEMNTGLSQPDLIPLQKPVSPLEKIRLWHIDLQDLITRQRQFGQNW